MYIPKCINKTYLRNEGKSVIGLEHIHFFLFTPVFYSRNPLCKCGLIDPPSRALLEILIVNY